MVADRPLIIRARLVLPIVKPPIEDGAVIVARGRIVAVGQWRGLRRNFSGYVQDVGEVILLPGLVNAHCHLDYTHMAGLFPPQKSFCDWIKLITTEKAHWTFSDFAASWIAGAKMLVQSGTTTVADVEAVPELLSEAVTATPLRVISFLEMTGVRSRRNPDAILAEALAVIDGHDEHRSQIGLSPHAPYSTSPKLLQLTATLARKRKLRMVTHIAESATEFEMFRCSSGEMYEWLRRNARDMSDCDGCSPVEHLARYRVLGPNLLAVHVNYLAKRDINLLAKKRVHVVHCPRSHQYFQHRPFPYRELSRAGLNICLGTDSLATCLKAPRREPQLSLFHEMQTFAAKHSDIASEEILRMATINGAGALGLRGKAGLMRPGAFADLITLPLNADSSNIYDSVVHYPSQNGVRACMINGEWVKPPDH